MQCSICSGNGVQFSEKTSESTMLFKCRYCGLAFCYNHRLPLNHLCKNLDAYKNKEKLAQEYINRLSRKSVNPQEQVRTTIKDIVTLRFSRVEILHLLLGTGLVTAVGLSLYNYRLNVEFLAIFISAFIIHELAHKFLAQFYNAWAEFRVQLYGLIVTAISALPIMPFKFIAPGAVFIGGSLSSDRHGRVSLIGPLTNLVMGFGFLLVHFVVPQNQYVFVGATFNGWIALFNMLPFGGLDGQKIFSWNKVTWGLTIAASALLFIFGYLR